MAPILEANDTISVPHTSPKTAPPASVMMRGAGSDNPVTAT